MSYKKQNVKQYRLDRHAVSDASCRWCKGLKDTSSGSMHCRDPGRIISSQNVCEKYEDTRLAYMDTLRSARSKVLDLLANEQRTKSEIEIEFRKANINLPKRLQLPKDYDAVGKLLDDMVDKKLIEKDGVYYRVNLETLITSKKPNVADFKIEQDEEGKNWIRVFKGKKWFSVPDDETSDEDLAMLMMNFDKEWQARVGQNLE